MVVGICTIHIHLPLSHSLKDKRRIVRSLKDRLRGRHNISLAEVDCQDLWQRAALGIAAVADGRQPLERLFEIIRADVETHVPGEILDWETDYV